MAAKLRAPARHRITRAGERPQPSCAVGRTRISLTSMCGGCDTASRTARAMSSGSAGLRGCRRTASRSRPGEISVVRMPCRRGPRGSTPTSRSPPTSCSSTGCRTTRYDPHRAGEQDVPARSFSAGIAARTCSRAEDVDQDHVPRVLRRLLDQPRAAPTRRWRTRRRRGRTRRRRRRSAGSLSSQRVTSVSTRGPASVAQSGRPARRACPSSARPARRGIPPRRPDGRWPRRCRSWRR